MLNVSNQYVVCIQLAHSILVKISLKNLDDNQRSLFYYYLVFWAIIL